ncbi:hypothetical protein BD309DRAFT_963798 [Dichomitus squalens]|uniref:Uncharacterized protein n=1 Tax=Dichomitus squalens TaxID=114155 RepID=A0A4Q9PLV0_9APHY|nr:hypothetical protein BD309DRAFT_963798 [Dichomitus squalens]TBU55187.1 hypothetical protein BD310DRAFT_934193 [Dichomitus squalens]
MISPRQLNHFILAYSGSGLRRAGHVPVYWPILVAYFFVLFLLIMHNQIQCLLLPRDSPQGCSRSV